MNSTSSTTLGFGASIGLRAVRQPPTVPQPVAQISKPLLARSSTAACFTLAATLFGFIPPPTFVETAQFTNPSRSTSRKESTILGCHTDPSQDEAIKTYWLQHPTAQQFVQNVISIIDEVYGVNTTRTIRVVDDLDTGKPIMELTIFSGLPIDEGFIEKDLRLFQKVAASELSLGFHDVVISQG